MKCKWDQSHIPKSNFIWGQVISYIENTKNCFIWKLWEQLEPCVCNRCGVNANVSLHLSYNHNNMENQQTATYFFFLFLFFSSYLAKWGWYCSNSCRRRKHSCGWEKKVEGSIASDKATSFSGIKCFCLSYHVWIWLTIHGSVAYLISYWGSIYNEGQIAAAQLRCILGLSVQGY